MFDLKLSKISGMDVPPPDTMGQTFDRLEQAGMLTTILALNLKKAVGFRNIAVAAKQVPVAQGEKFITAMPNWQLPLDCFPARADFYKNETCL